MIDAAGISGRIARLCGRLGGNERVCYRWLINRVAPDAESAMALLAVCRPFLVTSTGRTGTKWLASVLNEVQQAYVVHEPVPQETFYHAQALTDRQEALPYLLDFRLGEMAIRILTQNPTAYGEVNGALRRHVAALRQLVPSFRVVHLVRDGRDVVASMMNRTTGTPQDRIYGSIELPADAIDPAEWRSMDRFSRICWMWANENAYIRDQSQSLAKFEEITTQYNLFKEQILAPLFLDLDEEIWRMRSMKPVNGTPVHRFPRYEDWPDGQKDTFWRHCEAEMAEYGYFR